MVQAAGGGTAFRRPQIIGATVAILLVGWFFPPGILMALCLMVYGYGHHDRILAVFGVVILSVFLFSLVLRHGAFIEPKGCSTCWERLGSLDCKVRFLSGKGISMRVKVTLFLGLAVLAVLNYQIYRKESLIKSSEEIFLELAPVDPRSLMQGDYMALEYKIANEMRRKLRDQGGVSQNSIAVVSLNNKRIALTRDSGLGNLWKLVSVS